jgi:glutamine synthetase
MRAADDAVFVKLAVKEVAASLGLRASFLAKTRPGEEGSSGHLHLSCWADGVNAFVGGSHGDRLPDTFAAVVAGVLEHLPAASLMLNPTINSYKRLVPGWFAPVNVSWGLENRSCAVRAIRGEDRDKWRIECRRPGADANPYLALAALAAAAADGLKRGLTPPAPIVGDASERSDLKPLPGSLESALAAFDADGGLRSAIGEVFCDYYRASREWELAAWRESVSDWERERYERAV